MSPIYGSVLYGSAVYDGAPATGSPLALRRAIYGGWAPWLPANVISWRRKCVRFYAVDPDTLAWDTDPLPQVTNGCSRAIDTKDALIATDQLKLQVADPEGLYLPGGALAAVLAPNALVGVEVAVTTPAGSLTTRPNFYRVTTGLSQDTDRWGRTVFNTSAVDWFHSAADQYFPGPPGTATPWGPLPETLTLETVTLPLAAWAPLDLAMALSLWAQAQGAPPPPLILGTPNCWGSVASVLLYLFTDGRLVVDPSVPPGYDTPTGIQYAKNWSDPLAAKTGVASWRDVFTWLADNVPYRLAFRDDGDVGMYGAVERRDSGYVISCDPTFAGDFPVPWESIKRNVARAANSAVAIWYSFLDDGHPPAPVIRRAAFVESTASRNPNVVPIGKTENLLSQFADATAIPGSSAGDTAVDVAARRLRDALGQADTLTIATDSACPPPGGGDEVTVYLPDEQIIGRWAFMGAAIPFSVQPASWTLQWRDDSPGLHHSEG